MTMLRGGIGRNTLAITLQITAKSADWPLTYGWFLPILYGPAASQARRNS
jgi:hypothetical protein